MILLRQIKLHVGENKDKLLKTAAHILKCNPEDIITFNITRESVDARKKPDIFLVYELEIALRFLPDPKQEENYIKKQHIKGAEVVERRKYSFPYRAEGINSTSGSEAIRDLQHRPVIVGMGPAGLFCALVLSRAGFSPIILERGRCVEERTEDVKHFWNSGCLNTESNVQFGEGGAGTFSDGKLNTLVKGSKEIHRFVLSEFVHFGASDEIMYSAKPHIGTDVLRTVIKNMREEIIRNGGEVHFNSKVKRFLSENGRLTGLVYEQDKKDISLECSKVCLAIGHSARDTFRELLNENIIMQPKPFAVGVRMEHPQEMINISQYGGQADYDKLPAAPYKLTARAANGRSVYSFCMCPGGYVVNASSEKNRLAINGMSYSKRGGKNANSAIVVNVTPEDFVNEFGEDIFCGMHFQEKLEENAFMLANGKIPVQTYGDFVNGRATTGLGDIVPCTKGGYELSSLNGLFPEFINEALISAIPQFGRKIKGFDRPDALMLGVESRTSSPIRIVRDETMQSSIKGIYPCGEGAGYAGGITSAAIDGIRVAEAIAKNQRGSSLLKKQVTNN